MVNVNGLGKKFAVKMQQQADARFYLGTIVEVAQDSGTSIKVLDEVNKYFVQLHGAEENNVIEAYNVSGVRPRVDMKVVITYTEGVPEILRQAPKSATEFYGEYAPALSGTDTIGELTNSVWTGRNLGFGRLSMVSSDEPLLIRVEAHWYEWYGQIKRWVGGTIDLTDYLPTTTDYWWFAWVCIDPSEDILVVVTGSEVEGYALLTDTLQAEIGATLSGLHPVDALKLQEGITTLARPEYYTDGRVFLTNAQLPTVPIEVTTPYEIIPAGRKLHWPAPLDITTGTLTIDGEVIIL